MTKKFQTLVTGKKKKNAIMFRIMAIEMDVLTLALWARAI